MGPAKKKLLTKIFGMDQEVFFDVRPFDRTKVDLNKTPTTVDEFMKQMIVSRELCPAVAYIDPKKIPKLEKSRINLVPADNSIKCVSKFAPGKEWNMEKSNYFGHERELLEEMQVERIKGIQLPAAADREAWYKICFKERLKNFTLAPEVEERLAYHTGTPPTLRLVKHLSDNQVNHLLPFQIEYVIENGFSRSVLQWIFALLLVVKKPLLHDVCSALRVLARQCRAWRSEFGEGDLSQILTCSAMIAIVSIYFGQKDLSD